MSKSPDDKEPLDPELDAFLAEANFQARARSASAKMIMGFGISVVAGIMLGNGTAGLCAGLILGVLCAIGLARLTT